MLWRLSGWPRGGAAIGSAWPRHDYLYGRLRQLARQARISNADEAQTFVKLWRDLTDLEGGCGGADEIESCVKRLTDDAAVRLARTILNLYHGLDPSGPYPTPEFPLTSGVSSTPKNLIQRMPPITSPGKRSAAASLVSRWGRYRATNSRLEAMVSAAGMERHPWMPRARRFWRFHVRLMTTGSCPLLTTTASQISFGFPLIS